MTDVSLYFYSVKVWDVSTGRIRALPDLPSPGERATPPPHSSPRDYRFCT